MGHYRSEMLPDATPEASALHTRYVATQEKLNDVPIGKWSVKQFSEARRFINLYREAHELNKDLLAHECRSDIQKMENLINKATS